MEKVIKAIRYALLGCLTLFVIFSVARCAYDNRVVALESENKIYYNSEVYEETFEAFDCEIGRCLGRVEFSSYDSKYRMYSLVGKTEYIWVDFYLDHRIYKKILD